MKLLIAYSSRNGTSRECAEMLRDRIPEFINTTLCDLAQSSPDLSGYDCAVLGGPVIMGRFEKHVRRFLNDNATSLSKMPCAVFICCGFSQNFDEYADILIPKNLNCSLGVHHFGGELKPEKLRGIDKLIVKIGRNSIKNADFEDRDAVNLSLPEIIPENIALLAQAIKNIATGT
ncbi:MAG: flavodoxin domain-containing protein [Eubacteriales bacterium]